MPYKPKRCEVVPEANHQVSLRIDGREKTRWHFSEGYPRPFFYPLLAGGSESLTRLGHPGAPNHDHHRSVWFAHAKVLGIDFWSDRTKARIKQQDWLAYRDGDDEAVMACALGWYDGHEPKPLLTQELVAAIRPLEKESWELELQSTFRPNADSLEFRQSNFGFLAVRIAKSISAYFGEGTITGDNGKTGEPALFGKPAKWIDYTGPLRGDKPGETRTAGITYFDHPGNQGHPLKWHVREDGWMGASVCRDGAVTTKKKKPLVIRHALHIHTGGYDAKRAGELFAAFTKRPVFDVARSKRRHRQFEVNRRT